MTLSRVVLPAPLGPMTPNVSAAETARETSSRAVRPPNLFVTESITSSCSSPGPLCETSTGLFHVVENRNGAVLAAAELVHGHRRREFARPAVLGFAPEDHCRCSRHERRLDRRVGHRVENRVGIIDDTGILDRLQGESRLRPEQHALRRVPATGTFVLIGFTVILQ